MRERKYTISTKSSKFLKKYILLTFVYLPFNVLWVSKGPIHQPFSTMQLLLAVDEWAGFLANKGVSNGGAAGARWWQVGRNGEVAGMFIWPW